MPKRLTKTSFMGDALLNVVGDLLGLLANHRYAELGKHIRVFYQESLIAEAVVKTKEYDSLLKASRVRRGTSLYRGRVFNLDA